MKFLKLKYHNPIERSLFNHLITYIDIIKYDCSYDGF